MSKQSNSTQLLRKPKNKGNKNGNNNTNTKPKSVVSKFPKSCSIKTIDDMLNEVLG